MDTAWFEPLTAVCEEVCVATGSTQPVEVVLFYLARWCQKESGEPSPNLRALGGPRVREIAERIARNLVEDGERVTRLMDGYVRAWTDLRRLLLASLRARGEVEAGDRADEALQKVAEVLLAGTPPARAPERLRDGLEGPGNEFVFTSPFRNWARTVAKNVAVDEHRRESRARKPRAAPQKRRTPPIDRARLTEARDSLPSLVAAIRELPAVQRSVMVMSLRRADVDEVIRNRLHEIDPVLFPDPADRSLTSDRDIAERLGTTFKLVTANRSVARGKLASRDPRWALLLEFVLPHRSTKPHDQEDD